MTEHDVLVGFRLRLFSLADELGNIFGGLTGGCDASPSGGCLQKFVKKTPGAKKTSTTASK